MLRALHLSVVTWLFRAIPYTGVETGRFCVSGKKILGGDEVKIKA